MPGSAAVQKFEALLLSREQVFKKSFPTKIELLKNVLISAVAAILEAPRGASLQTIFLQNFGWQG